MVNMPKSRLDALIKAILDGNGSGSLKLDVAMGKFGQVPSQTMCQNFTLKHHITLKLGLLGN